MLIQNMGGHTKSIMVFSASANTETNDHGSLWSLSFGNQVLFANPCCSLLKGCGIDLTTTLHEGEGRMK